MFAQKRKGEFSFEISPLLPIFEDPVRSQITTTRHFRVVRDVRAEPAVSRTLPLSHSLQELFCSMRGSQFPGCSRESRFGYLTVSSPTPLRVSSAMALPSSVAGSLPNLVPDSHPEFLRQIPCGFRFRLRRRSFPGALASSASGSPMALSCSLLLEDCSSVELKDTPDCDGRKGV
jgi:hypothetical protein